MILLLDSPWNIDVVVHDPVCDLWCEVEDGVFVRLDRLGGVNDKHQGGIEDLAGTPSLTESPAAGLGAVLTLAADTPEAARHGCIELMDYTAVICSVLQYHCSTLIMRSDAWSQ